MKTYAINICLLPSQPVYDICCELNRHDRSDYNENSRNYIPHATLVMKCIDKTQLGSVIKKIKELKMKKITVKTGEYYLNNWCNTSWTGVYLENLVKPLQEQIADITSKINKEKASAESYAIDTFYSEEVNQSLALLDEQDFLSKDTMHLSFGLTDIQKNYNDSLFPNEVTFDQLCIGHMGNYGSVRDILFTKELL